MLTTWSVAYLAGWVVGTIAVFVAGRILNERSTPAPHPVALSVVAGAVWPMLVIGALEFAAVALFAKVRDWRAAAEAPDFWMSRPVVASSISLR